MRKLIAANICIISMLIGLFAPTALLAQECRPLIGYLDEVLAKKEIEVARLNSIYEANRSKYLAREARYSKSGYVPLKVEERTRIFNDLIKEAGDEKAVFDLRLNSKADELVPLLKAHRHAQIIDPKIVDGKLIAKLNGTDPNLVHTVEIPLEAIDNFAFWKGLERAGERKVVSFTDSTGKALDDFMRAVGENKDPRDYTKAFSSMRDDWQHQNDILAAIETKARSGKPLSEREFMVGLMVDRNRTQATPARINEFLSAFEKRSGAMKGAEPTPKDLLANISMDPAMRERAERLLSSVPGKHLPPAVVTRETAVVARGGDSLVPRAQIPGTQVVVSDEAAKVASDSRLALDRPRVRVDASDVTDGGARKIETGEILHRTDPGPREGYKTVGEPEVARGGDSLVPRAHSSGTELAIVEDAADTGHEARLALDSPRVKVDVTDTTDGGARKIETAEILHRTDPGPRDGYKTVGEPEVARGGDSLVPRNRSPSTEVAIVEDAVEAGGDARLALPDEASKRLAITDQRQESVIIMRNEASGPTIHLPDQSVPKAAIDDVVEGAKTADNAPRTGFKLTWAGVKNAGIKAATYAAGITGLAYLYNSLTGPSSTPTEENKGDDQGQVVATPTPTPTQAPTNDTNRSPAELSEALENINIIVSHDKTTENKAVWKIKFKIEVVNQKPGTEELLKNGFFNILCDEEAKKQTDCMKKGGKGIEEVSFDFKRLKDQDYKLDVMWDFGGRSENAKVDRRFTILKLNCDNFDAENADIKAACESVEEYVPTFNGVSGPQLAPMPQFPPLKGRGVFITPGFN